MTIDHLLQTLADQLLLVLFFLHSLCRVMQRAKGNSAAADIPLW